MLTQNIQHTVRYKCCGVERVTSHAATSAVLSGGVQEDGDSAYLLQFSNFDIDVQFYINIHNRLDKAPMKFLEICKVLNH